MSWFITNQISAAKSETPHDLAPRGRDEGDLDWPMAWLRRHDDYDD